MNPSLNLYPAKIQAQCACAITQLDEQISALNMLKGSINEFVSDSSIHSVSFNQLKSQCRNYLDVIDAMIYCNEADKADFVTLQGSVGNENLIGAIIDKWEKYYKKKLGETRRNYENVKDMVSGYAALQMQTYYANLIQMYQQLYDYWYAKELAYYEIDGRTSFLFGNGMRRQSIQNMLEGLKASFTLIDGYNSSIVAAHMARIENVTTESVPTNPEVLAAWDALIQSGMSIEAARSILYDLRAFNSDYLENIKHIISSVGFATGVRAVNISEVTYLNWMNKSYKLGQYYVDNVHTYCKKHVGEPGYGSTAAGRRKYAVTLGKLNGAFDEKIVQDDCSSFVYYSLVYSGFLDYVDAPPESKGYLPNSGYAVVSNLKKQGFVWHWSTELSAEKIKKGDILVRDGHVEIFDHYDRNGTEWAYTWGAVYDKEPTDKAINKQNILSQYSGVWRYEGSN